MNIVIFYFSGTGNTWWTSLELKKELENLGNKVKMFSLENPTLKEKEFVQNKINNADHVIVGYPIYSADLPENMKHFVYNLPKVSNGKGFTAFCTQGSFSGDGTRYFKKEIEHKGYNFLQNFQVNMTTNFNVAMLPFSLSKPATGKKLEKKKQKAIKKIKKVSKLITKNEKYIEGKRCYQIILGYFMRKSFEYGMKKMIKMFKFSEERCTKCKLCVKTCPTKSLSLEESDTLKLNRKDTCILCFRCYNFCPELAINFGRKIKDPTKYKRHTGPIKNLKIADIRK